MNRCSAVVASCAIAALLPVAAIAQSHSLVLRVTDSSGTAIPYASITYKGGSTVSDREGVTRIPRLQRGSHAINVRRLGFQPVRLDVALSSDTTIAVAMMPIATVLDAQVISARSMNALERTGFYDRMLDANRGLITGYFITPEEIERRKPSMVSQVLYEVPSIRLSHVHPVGIVPLGPDGCALTIYLDGVRFSTYASGVGGSVSSLAPRPQRTPRRGDGVDDQIPATHITAIEVYPRGTRAPSQYQLLNGTCGILAFWTKS